MLVVDLDGQAWLINLPYECINNSLSVPICPYPEFMVEIES